MTENEFNNSYIVGFQFSLEGDPETYQGTTTITTEVPLDENNADHFTEIAKVIFRTINEDNPEQRCEKVVITSIAEDSEEVKAIKSILDHGSNKVTDDLYI